MQISINAPPRSKAWGGRRLRSGGQKRGSQEPKLYLEAWRRQLAAASGRRRWPICWCCLDRGPGSFDVEDATTLSWSSAAVSEWVSDVDITLDPLSRVDRGMQWATEMLPLKRARSVERSFNYPPPRMTGINVLLTHLFEALLAVHRNVTRKNVKLQ